MRFKTPRLRREVQEPPEPAGHPHPHLTHRPAQGDLAEIEPRTVRVHPRGHHSFSAAKSQVRGVPSRGHRTISISASGHWWREGGRETGLDLQAGAPRRADRFLRGQLGLVHRRRVLRQYRRVHQVPLPKLRWIIDPLVAPPPRFRLSLHAPIVVLDEPRRTVARNV